MESQELVVRSKRLHFFILWARSESGKSERWLVKCNQVQAAHAHTTPSTTLSPSSQFTLEYIVPRIDKMVIKEKEKISNARYSSYRKPSTGVQESAGGEAGLEGWQGLYQQGRKKKWGLGKIRHMSPFWRRFDRKARLNRWGYTSQSKITGWKTSNSYLKMVIIEEIAKAKWFIPYFLSSGSCISPTW